MHDFGLNVSALLGKYGAQREAAAAIGVSPQRLNAICKGRGEDLRLSTAISLAEHLNVSLGHLCLPHDEFCALSRIAARLERIASSKGRKRDRERRAQREAEEQALAEEKAAAKAKRKRAGSAKAKAG